MLVPPFCLFLSVMKFEIDLPSLVTGILVWQFLAMCLGDSLHAILGNANLVTKASFPRVVLPLSTVLANAVNFLLSMVVLLVYLLAVRADIGMHTVDSPPPSCSPVVSCTAPAAAWVAITPLVGVVPEPSTGAFPGCPRSRPEVSARRVGGASGGG